MWFGVVPAFASTSWHRSTHTLSTVSRKIFTRSGLGIRVATKAQELFVHDLKALIEPREAGVILAGVVAVLTPFLSGSQQLLALRTHRSASEAAEKRPDASEANAAKFWAYAVNSKEICLVSRSIVAILKLRT